MKIPNDKRCRLCCYWNERGVDCSVRTSLACPMRTDEMILDYVKHGTKPKDG